MYQSKKNILFPAGAFIFGCILAVLLRIPSSDQPTEPLVTFGRFLRNLSLKSGTGNLGAWAIVITLSCLPLLGLLWKNRSKADFLLILSGAEIFAMLYYLINPTRISRILNRIDVSMTAKAWAFTAAGCVIATLICWALLRLLKVLVKKPAEVLPTFLFCTAVIYALLLGFTGVQGIESVIWELTQGNTQENLISASRTMIVVLHILALIPDVLSVWVILLTGKLTLGLEKDPFSAETIVLAESISKKAVLIATSSLLLTVLGNALQLLWFPKLLRIHMEIHVPLLTLILCAVLILLCKYFHRAKEVNDDNASII